MTFFRSRLVWAAAIILTVLAAYNQPAFAQRRVFSNEDVQTAPTASEAAPAASATGQAAPSDQSQGKASETPTGTTGDMPATPIAELNRLKAIQQTFLDLYDEITVKGDEIKDPVLKQRFTGMIDSLGTVIRANKQTIEEQEARLGAAARPAPEAQTGSAESQSATATQ